jgi:hypothetical protein
MPAATPTLALAVHSSLAWTSIVENNNCPAKSNRYKNKLLVSSHIYKNNNRPKCARLELVAQTRPKRREERCNQWDSDNLL